MSETQDKAAEVQKNAVDPYTVLHNLKGPTKAQVDALKASTCNGRVQIFAPDMKRVFVVRGLSAREWEAAQNEVPANVVPEKFEQALQHAILVKACYWTSLTGGQLTDEALRMSGAGLAPAMYELVCRLSDFIPPAMLESFSADL